MDFVIRCDCGRSLTVPAGAAGSAVECACGRTVPVPSLSALKRQAGLAAYPHTAAGDPWGLRRLPVACEVCGVEADTRWAVFHRNIGAVVVRFPGTVAARMCKG